MSGFQGADVDGLDTTASRMLQAAQACTTIATALAALATALEAMSWTGFAAAFAAYLRGVVIPWVKATGAALQAFGKLLELTSSDQKATSGDTPVITTGSGGYTSPQMPQVSCGDGPQVASITINITNGQMGQGSGVQVDRPALPGSIPGSVVNPGGGSSGSGAGAPVPSAPTPTPIPTGSGSSGQGSGSVVGPGTIGGSAIPSGSVGAASGGSAPVSGAGSTGGGGASGGWSGNLGVSSRPDGGIDVEGSFRGTIGGDPASTSTPVVPGQGHSSIDSGVTTGKTPGGAPGGLNAGLLAAPLGLAGLGAALLGAKGAGASGATEPTGAGTSPAAGGTSTPAGTSPAPTPAPATGSGSLDDESGWRVLATAGADGQLALSLVADTDQVPSALDLGGAAGQTPKILGWLDGDGDYGFVADDLVFTTPAGEVTIDHLTLEGSLADEPTSAAAVRGWWATALAEGTASTTPAPVPLPAPALTPALATTAKES
ncbi:hypothetical protein JNB_06689 [Janibacter sp. HTCC2649]|uniref:hypothetical protein n=1 Tax=Janibacter sp. HTCC2649 TaxID=313589 RepID=UPI0000670B95|nr:hypothetical protein [Janibacter sp. HTCC2649]EAP99835.1 hypothetical protein JNB_06689 [Janibacter sp. HTCC2649]